MIVPATFAFIPPFFIGLITVLLAWPGPYRRDLPFKIALALGIGPGIVSCLYFLYSLVLRPRSRPYWLLEGGLLAGLLLAAWLLRGLKNREASLSSGLADPPNRSSYLLLGVFGFIAVIAAASFILQSFMQPHGIQDAWNIWNMRARFMFRGGPGWTDLFTPALYWLNHPDYPFLVTAGAARAWHLLGQETTAIPAVQAALYAAGLTGVLLTGLGSRHSWGQGTLAGTLLASSAWFVLFGAWQIADVPLTFFYTSALFFLVLVLSDTAPTHPGLLFLLALTGGLAAWTKNEGILFALLLGAIWFLARLAARSSPRVLLRELAGLLPGLFLPILALLILKLVLAPASDLFAGQSGSSIAARLADPARYTLTLEYLWHSVQTFSTFKGWSLTILPFLAVYALLHWPARGERALRGLAYAAACLFLLALGYFAIYLITPHDLVWHLRTSTNRLLFHLYPPGLLLLFWFLRQPEAALTNPQERT